MEAAPYDAMSDDGNDDIGILAHRPHRGIRHSRFDSDIIDDQLPSMSEIDAEAAYRVSYWAHKVKMFSIIQGISAFLMLLNALWFANFIDIVAALNGFRGASLERQELVLTYLILQGTMAVKNFGMELYQWSFEHLLNRSARIIVYLNWFLIPVSIFLGQRLYSALEHQNSSGFLDTRRVPGDADVDFDSFDAERVRRNSTLHAVA
jgi:hypothetical protein